MYVVKLKKTCGLKTLLQKKSVFKNVSSTVFLPKIVFRKTLLCGWVETFVPCFWCRWSRTLAFVWYFSFQNWFGNFDWLWVENHTAWNPEKKIAMSQSLVISSQCRCVVIGGKTCGFQPLSSLLITTHLISSQYIWRRGSGLQAAPGDRCM